MGFAPTWLRQVSPPASQNHFNHYDGVECKPMRCFYDVKLHAKKQIVPYWGD